jgi:hypothetical protein
VIPGLPFIFLHDGNGHQCTRCRHEVGGQCYHEWDDRTFADSVVRRRIVVAATAQEQFPAAHVHRFYCQGKGFQAVGGGA